MPHFQIQKGVELPEAVSTPGVSRNQELIDILLQMEAGDSFSAPIARRGSIDGVLYTLRRKGKLPGKRFATRKEDNVTVRVWRVE